MTGPGSDTPRRWMKADLHVHSYHSGYNHDLPFLHSRDCYTDPAAVYRTAKARGMDLVTLTDHDSIDGCREFLDRHPDTPDFIIGEEISCWTPATTDASGAAQRPIEVHLGAYGMTEQAHREIQPLRKNAFEVMAYLRQAGIFFAVNHLFHFYKGQMPMARYLSLLLDNSPALETRNGAMLPAHNALIEELRARVWPEGRNTSRPSLRHAIVAGSDAHTLRRVGRTWTSVPAASREEFLTNLAAGLGRAEGQQGGAVPLAADIYGVIADYWLCLIGLQRHEISLPRRAFGLGFSIVSAPFEFIPFVIARQTKRGEARRVQEAADWVARAAAGTADTRAHADVHAAVQSLGEAPGSRASAAGVDVVDVDAVDAVAVTDAAVGAEAAHAAEAAVAHPDAISEAVHG